MTEECRARLAAVLQLLDDAGQVDAACYVALAIDALRGDGGLSDLAIVRTASAA